MFLGGQETGAAWASILFGDRSPTGRLPLMIPATEDDQIPPGTGDDVEYSEGTETSYRNHNFKAAFPFGHGLTFTTFEYANPVAVPCGGQTAAAAVRGPTSEKQAGHAVACIQVRVRNAGRSPGQDVVQLYLDFPPEAGHPGPLLKGFQKTGVIAPGDAVEVVLRLTRRDLSYYDADAKGWKEAPFLKAHVGASSADLRGSAVRLTRDKASGEWRVARPGEGPAPTAAPTAAPTLSPALIQYHTLDNKNAYAPYGAVDIDEGPEGVDVMDASDCQDRCTLDHTCDCATFYESKLKCWKRRECVVSKMTSPFNDGYTVFVKSFEKKKNKKKVEGSDEWDEQAAAVEEVLMMKHEVIPGQLRGTADSDGPSTAPYIAAAFFAGVAIFAAVAVPLRRRRTLAQAAAGEAGSDSSPSISMSRYGGSSSLSRAFGSFGSRGHLGDLDASATSPTPMLQQPPSTQNLLVRGSLETQAA
jgi:hypothetical protein